MKLGRIKARFPNPGFTPTVRVSSYLIHLWRYGPVWFRTQEFVRGKVCTTAIVFRWDHRAGWDGVSLYRESA